MFYKNGVNFAGPPPRPLDRAHISMSDDGRLIVDKGNIVGIDFTLQV
jgi:cytochrome b6-f complex iron-sulfur subunit